MNYDNNIFICHYTPLTERKEFMTTQCKKYNIDNVNGKSFNKLLEKEKERNVTIKISEIIKNNPNKQLMLNHPMHPSTFFFIKCLKLICKQINIPFFKDLKEFIHNKNYTNLPE